MVLSLIVVLSTVLILNVKKRICLYIFNFVKIFTSYRVMLPVLAHKWY